MTAKRAKKAMPAANPLEDEKCLKLIKREGVADGHLKAETIFHPIPRHAATGDMFAGQLFGKSNETTINDGVAVLTEACKKIRAGDLTDMRDMLTVQALTLDGLFTELARRAAMNLGQRLDETERYIRLGLKAQAQSRATIEALDRLARGGVQTVKHIHVDNRGGQAVIAETVNTGGRENGIPTAQPYAIESNTPSFGEPLWSENPEREFVPLARDAERTL